MGSGTSKASNPAATAKKPTTATIRGQEAKLLAGDAHPVSLAVLDLIKDADRCDDLGDYARMLDHVRQALVLLKDVPDDAADHLAVLVHQREGVSYQRQRNVPSAKTAYGKAIQIAELMVADKRPQIYMVLQRYCDAVMALSSMWEHEALHSYKSKATRASAASRNGGSGDSVASSIHIAAGGGVVPAAASSNTLNSDVSEEREARARAIHIYGPCEMALLRCVELVERGDHRQSELLILPLLELSRVYEALKIFPRAVLVIRRCIGILCVRYGHDHMRVIDLNARCDRLIILRDEQLLHEAVIKLQSLARMFAAMHRLEATLRRPVKRHRLPSKVSREQQQTRNVEFLYSYANLLWQQSSAAQNFMRTTNTNSMSVSSANSGAVGAGRSYGGLSSSAIHGTTSPVLSGTTIGAATSPSKTRGLPPQSPNVAALQTNAGTSRPSSSVAVGMRQTALINAGFTSSFARSSFATAAVSSRPGSATGNGLPPPSSRPGSGAVRTTTLSPPALAPDYREGPTASAEYRARPESHRMSLAALSGPSTSSTVVVRGNADNVGQDVVVKRGRLRSWAAHDIAQ
jgi:tetratricopeptide (TPR) repeat protein